MRDFNLKAWALALMVALLPCIANAVGLGRLTMLSALGDPLNAEIDLVSVTREELGSLSARIAAPDAYRQANLQYNQALVGARVSIERRAGGQPYIKIVSTRPVNEPFIDLLVEITSSSGRLMREYTALVDPPGAGAPPAPVAVAPPAARGAPATQPPATAAAPAIRRPSEPVAGAKEYGPIQRGESLSKIARSVMPEGVSLEQMLVGLYRSNPDAFIRKNLNLVKTGKILRVPDREEIAAIPQTDARKEYRAQVADWNSYRQGVADTAGTARADGKGMASGRISTRVEDKAGGEPKDVVRLSRGEPPSAEKGKPRSTAERVRALEEEVTAREKALKEANDRIAQLEKTIKDMQKLVELKSPGMAAAQQQAAKPKPEAKPEAKPEPKLETKAEPKPEPKPEAKPEPTPEAVAVAKPEAAKPEAPKPEAEKPAPEPRPEAKAEAPKPKPTVVPPPPPAPSLMDQIMAALSDPFYQAIGGGIVLLGALGLWMARRKRGDIVEEPERASPVFARTTAGATGAAAAAAAVAAEPTPAPPPAVVAVADEVDPLAEAEVYIAYGRDAQAEEILKEALSKNPHRQDVQLKLLEIYAARKDKGAFNKLASDLHAQTGGTGDAWLAAAGMGFALDPANKLYEVGRHAPATPTAPPATASDLDFEVGSGDMQNVATDIMLDSGARTQAAHETTAILEADELRRMAADGEKTTMADATPAPLMPDFTLEIPTATEPPTQTDISLEAPVPTQDGHMIDFQIELPKSEALDKTQVMAAAPDTDAGLDFKLDIPDLNLGDTPQAGAAGGGDKDGHWYDVQSKFDLAKAYQEMGDKDGAKDILQEVIKEGDAEQQAQAKKLLETLS